MKLSSSKGALLTLLYAPAALCLAPLLASTSVSAAPEEPCRAAIVLDRSESVTPSNLQTMKQQIARLFVGPSIEVDPVSGGLYTDKIHLAFWTFANLPTDSNFNAPYNGFVSSKGTDSGFNTNLNSVTRVAGSLKGYTNYMHGMAYNGSQLNPYGSMRSVVNQADIIVFLTDGVPNKPGDNNINAKSSARDAGRSAALRQKANGKILVGGFIKGRDADYNTGRREVNYIINGNFTNTTDTFDIESNYGNLTQQLKTIIASKCQLALKPYDLQPKITLPGGTVYESGETIPVDPSVRNNGPSPSSDTEWQLTQVILRPGDTSLDTKKAGGDSTDAPCGNFWRPSAGSECSTLQQGTSQFTRINVDTSLPHSNAKLNELPAGTRYCFGLSVRPPTHQDADHETWRHSALQCVKIGKRPKLQVRGGDFIVQGGIFTGRSYTDFLPSKQPDGSYTEKRTYGSWGEYGVLTSGSVDKFGSGGIFRTGLGEPRKDRGALTFTNNQTTSGTAQYGRYASNVQTGAEQLVRHFSSTSGARPDVASSASIDLSQLESGTYLLPNGDVRLHASSPLAQNRSLILLAESTTKVLIDSDITIPSTYASIRDISQVVIAPAQSSTSYRLAIASQVQRVDAWLLNPNGTIDTCRAATPASPHLSAGCDTILTVNGPVAAQRLLLRRVGGFDQDPAGLAQSQGAEIFNLRPDAYLWASAQYGADSGVYVTTNQRDLPPRY